MLGGLLICLTFPCESGTLLIMEPAAKKRFLSASDADVAEILTSRVPKSTKDTTSTWLSMFEKCLKDNNLKCDLRDCSRKELNNVLCRCYISMRRKDGGYYQEPGYHGFRAAIQRQLTCHDRQFNVHTDVEFQKSNDVLDGVLKRNKREGHSNPVQHKDPITDIDMDKISYFFDRSKTAENLTRHVWFFTTLHLGLRGREVQRKITKADVEFGTDAHGDFARLSADFATKITKAGADLLVATPVLER